MICRILSEIRAGKTSFGELMEYIAAGSRRERPLFSAALNMMKTPGQSPVGELVREMERTAGNRANCKDPAVHVLLEWSGGETPSREQCGEAVKIVLEELGMSGCKTFYGAHSDAGKIRLHLCVNRVNPNSFRAIYTPNPESACRNAAARIERAQGWKPSLESGIPGVTPDAMRTADAEGARRVAKERIAPLVLSARSWAEVHERLAACGVKLQRRGSGAVFLIGENPVKLSSASERLSFKKLVGRFGPYRPRDEAPAPGESGETSAPGGESAPSRADGREENAVPPLMAAMRSVETRLQYLSAISFEKTDSPADVYLRHARSIMAEHPDPDWERLDAQVALRMTVTGHSADEIREAVEHGAPRLRAAKSGDSGGGEPTGGWAEYARRAADYAAGERGQEQAARLSPLWKEYWLELEGSENRSEKGETFPRVQPRRENDSAR